MVMDGTLHYLLREITDNSYGIEVCPQKNNNIVFIMAEDTPATSELHFSFSEQRVGT